LPTEFTKTYPEADFVFDPINRIDPSGTADKKPIVLDDFIIEEEAPQGDKDAQSERSQTAGQSVKARSEKTGNPIRTINPTQQEILEWLKQVREWEAG
jgi:hypothetical protein